VLNGDDTPLKPAQLEVLAPTRAAVTIVEGRYHQVRRMFAACGNHVSALQRVALGPLTLGDLPAGAWRCLSPDELSALRGGP
jgi:16S rRNA pseudouridine516 synthase